MCLPRLLIVSAGDPMWRGGLSGPSSMFLHSDRPLISENRTSTLLHELGAHRARHPRRRGKRLDRRGARRVLFARSAAAFRRHQQAAIQGGVAAAVAVGEALADVVRLEFERADDCPCGAGAACGGRRDPQRERRQSRAWMTWRASSQASAARSAWCACRRSRRKLPADRCDRWSASSSLKPVSAPTAARDG